MEAASDPIIDGKPVSYWLAMLTNRRAAVLPRMPHLWDEYESQCHMLLLRAMRWWKPGVEIRSALLSWAWQAAVEAMRVEAKWKTHAHRPDSYSPGNFEELLDGLPEQEAEALRRRFLYGMSYREAAVARGLSPKSRQPEMVLVARGLARLRKLWGVSEPPAAADNED